MISPANRVVLLEHVVVEAALEWWKSHRPVVWDQALHLKDPDHGLRSSVDQLLARAVAALIRARIAGDEDAAEDET